MTEYIIMEREVGIFWTRVREFTARLSCGNNDSGEDAARRKHGAAQWCFERLEREALSRPFNNLAGEFEEAAI